MVRSSTRRVGGARARRTCPSPSCVTRSQNSRADLKARYSRGVKWTSSGDARLFQTASVGASPPPAESNEQTPRDHSLVRRLYYAIALKYSPDSSFYVADYRAYAAPKRGKNAGSRLITLSQRARERDFTLKAQATPSSSATRSPPSWNSAATGSEVSAHTLERD